MFFLDVLHSSSDDLTVLNPLEFLHSFA